MMSLEEMDKAQKLEVERRQLLLKLKATTEADGFPLINWGRVFAISIGVLIAIYFADCFRGTP